MSTARFASFHPFSRPLPWSNVHGALQWLLILSAWTLAAVVSFVRLILSVEYPLQPGVEYAIPIDAPTVLPYFPLTATCYSAWALCTPVLAWLVHRLPLDRPVGRTRAERLRTILRWLPIYVVSAVAAATVSVYVGWIVGRAYAKVARLRHPSGGAFVMTSQDYFMEAVVCLSAIAVLTLVARWHDARRREQDVSRLTLERLELENDLRDAQLQALRMKVNPHFLFNALQTVTALVRTDPRAAERMLVQMGDVLRMALRLDLTDEVSLKEELDVALGYLELEKVRFQGRLRVKVLVPPDLADVQVPSLVLQPLVENAIRHGVSRRRGVGELIIEAGRSGDALRLAIMDNGVGFTLDEMGEPAAGIGLGAVRSRLEKLYPGASGCRLWNRPEGGAAVELTIPLHRAGMKGGQVA